MVCCLTDIKLLVLFNAESILLEKLYSGYFTDSLEDKDVHAFLKDICPKLNVIARLEFELAYDDSSALTITPPRPLWLQDFKYSYLT